MSAMVDKVIQRRKASPRKRRNCSYVGSLFSATDWKIFCLLMQLHIICQSIVSVLLDLRFRTEWRLSLLRPFSGGLSNASEFIFGITCCCSSISPLTFCISYVNLKHGRSKTLISSNAFLDGFPLYCMGANSLLSTPNGFSIPLRHL